MRLYGLIGYPLAHSFSKKYFTDKFNREQINNCDYINFELSEISQINDVINNHPELIGLNVTIPFKTAVIPYLDEISDEAQKIGAVNTILIENFENKKILKGFNTDAFGFEQSLFPLLKPFHKRALIIGTGGAARSVFFVLSKLHFECLFVGRNKDGVAQNNMPNRISFNDLSEELMQQQHLIVNTTPIGMQPDINTCPPLPYAVIPAGLIAYDLIYNPEETLFLTKAKQQNAVIKNGLEMLHLQAEKAWEIWNGKM